MEHLTTIVYTKKGKGGGDKQSALLGIRKLRIPVHFSYRKRNGQKLLGLDFHMKGVGCRCLAEVLN